MSNKKTNILDESSPINPDFVARLSLIIFISILGGFVGEAYSAIFYNNAGDDFYQGFRNGFFIALFTSLFEMFYVQSGRKGWIRRLAFLPSLIVRILIITFIVRFTLVANDFFSQMMRGETLTFDGEVSAEIRDTVFSLGLIMFFVVLLQFSSLIGFKRFTNLMAGRYFRPVSEERIFLFVDLVGSSEAARELGDVRFHEYLADFFHQVDRAIVRNGGEIVSYVGDAVIVTWPLHDKAERNVACLKTIRFMEKQLRRQQAHFEREFGRVPQFRAALHGGPVVVGECGDSRRQITFLGDVVNMTSRIESACKERNEKVLISDELAKRIELPMDVSFKDVGLVELKGADRPRRLHAVHFQPGWENLIAPS